MTEKIFILGLDGATFTIIDHLIECGLLPNFKRLIQEGVKGTLFSTIPPVSACAWSSFITGVNPGKHGIFDFIKLKDKSYNITVTNSSDRNYPSLWKILNKFGKKAVVVNMPASFPPEPIENIFISGLMTPNEKSDFIHPPQLKKELVKKIGPYLLYPTTSYIEGGVKEFIRDINNVAEYRFKSSAYLLKKYYWDIFMVVFNDTDIMQHELWSFMDKAHPHYALNIKTPYKEAIYELYQKLDAYLGGYTNMLPDDCSIIIMSDHGSGSLHNFFYVNNWLRQEGYLVFKDSILTNLKLLAYRLGFTPKNIYLIGNYISRGRLKRRFNLGRSHSFMGYIFLSFDDIDWEKTRAYSLGNIGQVWVNLKGREHNGIVNPGKEYERLRDDIIKKLKAIKDQTTGFAVFKDVYKKEQIYSGRNSDRGPDIVFLSEGLNTVAFGEHAFVSLDILSPSFHLSGHHKMEGVLIMKGKHFRKDVHIKKADIVDLVPTLLYLSGIPIPSYIDGRVLKEAFTEEFLEKNPIEYIDNVEEEKERGGASLSLEEEESIKQRLRAMGYLS